MCMDREGWMNRWTSGKADAGMSGQWGTDRGRAGVYELCGGTTGPGRREPREYPRGAH